MPLEYTASTTQQQQQRPERCCEELTEFIITDIIAVQSGSLGAASLAAVRYSVLNPVRVEHLDLKR